MNTMIEISLDPAGIDRGIEALKAYQKRLEKKARELRWRVAKYIAEYAQPIFRSAVADDLIGESAIIGNVYVTAQENGNMALVIAHGKDAVFMEFGAGVYHNGAVGTSPNPWGAELGYTIGSYGKGNGRKEVWGYKDAEGLHLTHGTPASMPLFNAVMAMEKDLQKIAREVFST